MSRLNDLDNASGVPFPPSRLTSHDDVRFYYSFCRTPPEDLLNSVPDIVHPVVLLLGAGDVRSILYTFYRNFDPEFKGRFEGATFLVNENWSVLQAREILMLYLCLQLPHKIESREGRLLCAAMWSISFNHTLKSKHVEILESALEALVNFSGSIEAWSSSENPLGKIVKFRNLDSFRSITRHWKRWSLDRSTSNLPSIEEMVDLRTSFIVCLHKTAISEILSTYAEDCLSRLLGLSSDVIPEKTKKLMAADITNFLNNGSVSVEETLSLGDEENGKIIPNVTFFDGTQTAMQNNPFYACVPYLGFTQSFVFSQRDCCSGNVPRSLVDKLPVTDDKFDAHPLVANSVQQLVLWLSASSRALRKLSTQSNPNITFTFECCDPISMCLRMLREPEVYTSSIGVPPSFDVIHTSELVDCLSPPDLILNASPLVKPDCYMLATTVRYKMVGETLDRYLGSVFGVHPQIFMVMYGIRCVGVEATFSDCTLPRLIPWSHSNSRDMIDARTLVFKRQVFSPFKMTSIKDVGFFSKALVSCIHATTYSFPKNLYSHFMCMETIITNIQTFISLMDEDTPVDKWQFWTPFVDLLKEEPTILPYYHQLQTLAMLHSIHFHITVNERDCPMCRYRPISSFIAQFIVKIKDPEMTPNSTLAVFVTHGNMCVKTVLENAKDTHTINSVSLVADGDRGYSIEFFYPRSFTDPEYRLSIVRFGHTGCPDGTMENNSSVVYEGLMAEHVTQGSKYFFRQLPSRQQSMISQFGRMKSNVAECDKIRTVINLSPDLVYKVDYRNLAVASDQITQLHLCLKSEYCQYDVYFPYPVIFSEMKIEFHCKLNTATITATRDQHSFYDESPTFVVTPTNRLFLPACSVYPSPSRDYLELQTNFLEKETIKRMPSKYIPPIIRLKEMVRDLFQLVPHCRFIHLHSITKDKPNKMEAMFVVHDEVMDIDTGSPAIDLSYYFLKEEEDDEQQSLVNSVWSKMTSDHPARTLTVNSEYVEVVKKMFTYFSKCTHTVYSGNNHTTLCRIKVLRKHNVDSYFTRAVIFPLYATPDQHYEQAKPARGDIPDSKVSPGYIAGVFTPGGVPVSDEVRKVIEALSPQMFVKPKEVSRSAEASVNVMGATDLSGAGTLVQILQEAQSYSATGIFKTIAGFRPALMVGRRSYPESRPEERNGRRRVHKAKESSKKKSAASKTTPTPKVRETKEKALEKVREKAKEKVRMASAKTEEEEVKTTTVTKKESTASSKKESGSNEASQQKTRKRKVSDKSTPMVNGIQETATRAKTISKPSAANARKVDTGTNDPPISIDDSIAVEEKGSKHRSSNGRDTTRSKGRCTNCGQSSDQMKKCAGCGKTRYCSRSCQKHHWKQHKPDCITDAKDKGDVKQLSSATTAAKPSSTASSTLAHTIALKCNTCSKVSETLKRCKCYAVAYCDVRCQRQDWPNHKLTCSAAPNKVSLSLLFAHSILVLYMTFMYLHRSDF